MHNLRNGYDDIIMGLLNVVIKNNIYYNSFILFRSFNVPIHRIPIKCYLNKNFRKRFYIFFIVVRNISQI